MNALEIKSITKTFSAKEGAVVEDISFSLKSGNILSLLGESGSGKSTLLRLIAGLEKPDKGIITINGKVVVDKDSFVKPENRKVGFVFQNHALFPHLNVFENIAFGLKKLGRNEKKQIVENVLEMVNLPSLVDRYPHQLSGGQQQRVALARALAPKPNLILMDEPFSNLDNVLKNQVREEVRKILRKANATAIFVTHDTFDALQTADEIAFIQAGKLIQIDKPLDIYRHPVNEIVGGFFGRINTLNLTFENDICVSEIGKLSKVPTFFQNKSGKIVFRPDLVSMNPNGEFEGIIVSKQFMGDHFIIGIATGKKELKNCIIYLKIPAEQNADVDAITRFDINLEEALFINS